MKDLTIVILQYNGTDLTKALLKSIYDKEKAYLQDYQLLLIDNQSPEGDEFEYFRSHYPEIRLEKNDKNYGFANGLNPHLKEITTKYTLLINNDAELLNPAIHLTLSFLRKTDYDGATCSMLDANGHKTDNFSTNCSPYFRFFVNTFGITKLFVETVKRLKLTARVKFIHGGFLMLKTQAFKDVNYFCTNYFMYTEDQDLMIKLGKKGKKLYYVPKAEIVHYDGVSSAKVWSNDEKMTLQLNQTMDCYERHYGKRGLFFYRALMKLKLTLKNKKYVQVIKDYKPKS